MFNDRFSLTQAVLSGRKTMTRRIVKLDKLGEYNFDNALKHDWGKASIQAYIENEARYKVDEVVAIAQSYKNAGYEPGRNIPQKERGGLQARADSLAGWNNKLFTRADLMPHHIRITDIKIERLQNISDEDCFKEGIYKGQCGGADTHFMDAYYFKGDIQPYCTPRGAFAVLIDRVFGKDTWDSNPWVFAYEFELMD